MRKPRRESHSGTAVILKECILFGRSRRLPASVTHIALFVCLVLLNGCATVFSPAGDGALQTETIAAPLAPSAGLLDINRLQNSLEAVRKTLESNHDGEVYSGAVEGTEPDDFAIVVTTIDGQTAATGDSEKLFPFMSVSKPFTYTLALEQHGLDIMISKVGVNATGMPYNSLAALVVRHHPQQNPMVNAGAITTHSLIEANSSKEKIDRLVKLYSQLANRPLTINEAWRTTPRALSYALSYQMQNAGLLEGEVEDVLQRYLMSNIVGVTTADLAQMGATLAKGGIQPQTGNRVLQAETVKAVLSAMVTAGMYEDSGRWWTEVGLPAKSGVSGAILAVVPGWGAISAYSPRLDAAGNSVRAAAAIRELVRAWRLHSFDRLIDTAQ
jgi:glutaminase